MINRRRFIGRLLKLLILIITLGLTVFAVIGLPIISIEKGNLIIYPLFYLLIAIFVLWVVILVDLIIDMRKVRISVEENHLGLGEIEYERKELVSEKEIEDFLKDI